MLSETYFVYQEYAVLCYKRKCDSEGNFELALGDTA